MRVTLRVVPGFIWSAGLGFGGTRSGFAVAGCFGIWTGSDSVVVSVQNIVWLWTQSLKGLYQVSQWYPSTRVQLESKGGDIWFASHWMKIICAI